MDYESVQKLKHGIYRIHWVDDDKTSLAAVGSLRNGDRWHAACNWTVAPGVRWENVLKVELLIENNYRKGVSDMPCPNEDQCVEFSLVTDRDIDTLRTRNIELKNRVAELVDEVNKYEPAFCAVMTVLENRDDITSVAIEATEQTGVDILPPWTCHKERDLLRIKKDLSKYTEKELLMIASIVNNRSIVVDE